MSLRNSATCSRVGPVSTLVLLVEVGRVLAFGVVVGVRLPLGLGLVVFGVVVGGGFFGSVLGVGMVTFPILICAEVIAANIATRKIVTKTFKTAEYLFTLHLQR